MPPATVRIGRVGMIRQWHGVLSGADQLASMMDFADREWVGPVQYVVVDYRPVTRFDITSSDVIEAVERARSLHLGLRVAFIASEDLMFGFVRMWEMSTAANPPWVARVVRTVAEAISWLEHELPDLDFSEAREYLEQFRDPRSINT
jgi:hypothetical protein